VLDLLFANRPIQRFWVLETVARIPYFSAISLLHLYGAARWIALKGAPGARVFAVPGRGGSFGRGWQGPVYWRSADQILVPPRHLISVEGAPSHRRPFKPNSRTHQTPHTPCAAATAESLGFWRAGAELRKIHFAEEWNELHHLQVRACMHACGRVCSRISGAPSCRGSRAAGAVRTQLRALLLKSL